MGASIGRWSRFNIVGVMGFVIQALMLSLLVRCAGLETSLAVAIAVFAAVSHNFVWHEYFTWPNLPREARMKRWLSFQLSTGLLSVLTNVGVTTAVMAITGLPVVASNAVSVALVSVANFWVNDRVVFRS